MSRRLQDQLRIDAVSGFVADLLETRLERGNDMSNCFRMDLKRSIFCKKFCAVVLGVLIVLIISTWDDLKMYTRWGDVPGYSGPVDTLAKSLAFDKFKIVVVFLLGGLYTGSYCSDMQSRYIRSIFTRTTITSYTLTRFAVNCLAIILGMLVSFGLYSILCLFGGMPLVRTVTVEGLLFTEHLRYDIQFCI